MKILLIIVLSLFITLVICIGSLRTDRVFYPNTGIQDYDRSVLGLVIEPLSDKNLRECSKYNLGKLASGRSKVLISSCYLVFGCVVSQKPSDVFQCAT